MECVGLEEARSILGERDGFIQAMSQFDRCVRMKTSRLVTEAESSPGTCTTCTAMCGNGARIGMAITLADPSSIDSHL